MTTNPHEPLGISLIEQTHLGQTNQPPTTIRAGSASTPYIDCLLQVLRDTDVPGSFTGTNPGIFAEMGELDMPPRFAGSISQYCQLPEPMVGYGVSYAPFSGVTECYVSLDGGPWNLLRPGDCLLHPGFKGIRVRRPKWWNATQLANFTDGVITGGLSNSVNASNPDTSCTDNVVGLRVHLSPKILAPMVSDRIYNCAFANFNTEFATAHDATAIVEGTTRWFVVALLPPAGTFHMTVLNPTVVNGATIVVGLVATDFDWRLNQAAISKLVHTGATVNIVSGDRATFTIPRADAGNTHNPAEDTPLNHALRVVVLQVRELKFAGPIVANALDTLVKFQVLNASGPRFLPVGV